MFSASSREKSLLNEIARLRAELFEMASHESGGASSVDKRGSESKESKRQQSSEYTDQRYDVLRAEYDRVLKENKELKIKLAAGSKKEQPRVKADTSSQTSTAPVRVPVRSSAPTKAVASVSTRTPVQASTRAAAPVRTVTATVAPASARTPSPMMTATAAAAPAPVKTRIAEPEATGQNGPSAEAVRLMREGKVKEARALLDAELAKLPDDPGLLYLYGMVYCREGDFANAAKVLKHVVDTDQSNARARVALGGAYLAMHDYVNARMELEMAVGFDPDLAEAHYDLAQVLLVGTPSDPEGARDRYTEALKLGSQPDPAFEARLSRALPAKVQDK